MFKVANVNSLCFSYGRSFNIYELIDNNGKIRFAMDFINGQRKGKKIKIVNDSLGEKTVYSRLQLSKEKFLKLKTIALEQEVNNQKRLKNQYLRYYLKKKEIVEKAKEFLLENNIEELKKLLEIEE
jgi:hypothetical protein